MQQVELIFDDKKKKEEKNNNNNKTAVFQSGSQHYARMGDTSSQTNYT